MVCAQLLPLVAYTVNGTYCHILPFSLPHMATTKPKIIRLYLSEENQNALKDLEAIALDLSQQQLASMLLTAAMRAMKEANNKIRIPIRFAVMSDDERSGSRTAAIPPPVRR